MNTLEEEENFSKPTLQLNSHQRITQLGIVHCKIRGTIFEMEEKHSNGPTEEEIDNKAQGFISEAYHWLSMYPEKKDE